MTECRRGRSASSPTPTQSSVGTCGRRSPPGCTGAPRPGFVPVAVVDTDDAHSAGTEAGRRVTASGVRRRPRSSGWSGGHQKVPRAATGVSFRPSPAASGGDSDSVRQPAVEDARRRVTPRDIRTPSKAAEARGDASPTRSFRCAARRSRLRRATPTTRARVGRGVSRTTGCVDVPSARRRHDVHPFVEEADHGLHQRGVVVRVLIAPRHVRRHGVVDVRRPVPGIPLVGSDRGGVGRQEHVRPHVLAGQVVAGRQVFRVLDVRRIDGVEDRRAGLAEA